MAVAGGGQFHHLRTAEEIANTFIGELGDLLAVSASQVRLEIEVQPEIQVDLISAYWSSTESSTVTRCSLAIGDLTSGEERHVVARFGFPTRQRQPGHVVRARVLWVAEGQERSTDWQEVRFTYAANEACEAEPRDPSVMHWVGLHEPPAPSARPSSFNQAGDLPKAREALKKVASTITEYAGEDEALKSSLAELESTEQQMANAPLSIGLFERSHVPLSEYFARAKDHRGKKS